MVTVMVKLYPMHNTDQVDITEKIINLKFTAMH